MGTPYRVCEHCGAHLDANEKCDCRDPKKEEAAAETRPMKLVAVCREVDKDTGQMRFTRSTRRSPGPWFSNYRYGRSLTRNCGISRLRRDVGSGSGT